MQKYDLDDLTDLIRGTFVQGTGSEPVVAKRSVNARQWEYFEVNSIGTNVALGGASGNFIGNNPITGNNPYFYHGVWSYNAQGMTGASNAGDNIQLIAEVQTEVASTQVYYRRKAVQAALAVYSEIMNVEYSIPLLFQTFRFLSAGDPAAGTMIFNHTFTFKGIRILWG